MESRHHTSVGDVVLGVAVAVPPSYLLVIETVDVENPHLLDNGTLPRLSCTYTHAHTHASC